MLDEERMKIEDTIKLIKIENNNYQKIIVDNNAEKDYVEAHYHLVGKTFGWSLPAAFILNVAICLATQKVIGFIPAYIASLPVCFLAAKGILDSRLSKYINDNAILNDKVSANNDNINKLEHALEKVNSKSYEYTNQKENTTTNENTNQKVQVSDDFIKYYEKYFMNNDNNTRKQGPTRTLKR